MSTFDTAFTAVIGVEGGVTTDAGGLTKYGISQRAYPRLDIANLTLDQAKSIYLTDYWNRIQASSLPPGVAFIVFDGAVNQGVHAVAIMLQNAVGTEPDAIIGPITISAVNKMKPRDIIVEIAARRAVSYAGDDSTDWLGWYRRLMTMMAQALTL